MNACAHTHFGVGRSERAAADVHANARTCARARTQLAGRPVPAPAPWRVRPPARAPHGDVPGVRGHGGAEMPQLLGQWRAVRLSLPRARVCVSVRVCARRTHKTRARTRGRTRTHAPARAIPANLVNYRVQYTVRALGRACARGRARARTSMCAHTHARVRLCARARTCVCCAASCACACGCCHSATSPHWIPCHLTPRAS